MPDKRGWAAREWSAKAGEIGKQIAFRGNKGTDFKGISFHHKPADTMRVTLTTDHDGAFEITKIVQKWIKSCPRQSV